MGLETQRATPRQMGRGQMAGSLKIICPSFYFELSYTNHHL
ncbi:hypothetical protein [Alysiella filiformis]|nr:hypothetical protein [Alysiella filiformis]